MKYVKEEKVSKGKGMTTMKWIGFYLLPLILFVGSIIQIVLILKWAFGKHDDVTLKGFARAQILMVIISSVLIVGFIVLWSAMFQSYLEQLAQMH